jgi:hypothetical protein
MGSALWSALRSDMWSNLWSVPYIVIRIREVL